jgi:hypothetical protein
VFIVHAVFGDGALLTTFPTMIATPVPGTLLVDTIRLWRVDPVSYDRQLLVELPGPVWMWTGRFQLPVPLTANPLRAVSGTQLVVASGSGPEVRVLEPGGAVMARYILPDEPVVVTVPEVREMAHGWAARGMYGAPAGVWDEWLERMPVPADPPAFDRLLLDGDGGIWLRRFRSDDDSSVAPVWDVLGAGGRYLGALTTPPGLEVFSIAGDRLAGVSRDSLDVEHVDVHRIVKTP